MNFTTNCSLKNSWIIHGNSCSKKTPLLSFAITHQFVVDVLTKVAVSGCVNATGAKGKKHIEKFSLDHSLLVDQRNILVASYLSQYLCYLSHVQAEFETVCIVLKEIFLILYR